MHKTIILICIFILLICSSLIITVTFKKGCIDRIEYVDKKIESIISDASYQESSLEEREIIVFNLLSELKKDKYILFFSFDESTELFSFTYTNRSLGGIKLESFDCKVGSMPMG